MTRTDDRLLQLAVFPVYIDLVTSTGYQTLHGTILPYRRQGGQKIDESIIALHQHLGNTCRTTEVTVNLKWRMGVEHIGIGTATLLDSAENEERVSRQRQLVLDELIGMFAVQQTGP